ncbi:MAG: hypothetical protein ACC653_07145 [Gammaproteobacteria bacterium]
MKQIFYTRFNLIFFSLLFLSLTACDGGETTATTNTDPAPTVSSVTIINGTGANSNAKVGDNLNGQYVFDKKSVGDLSSLQWYVNSIAITGNNSAVYVVQSADAGKKITFEVTPHADSGTKDGTAVSVDIDVELNTGGGGNTANAAPTLNPVIEMAGMSVTKAASGDMLTAIPNYADAENDQMGPASLTFKWFKTGTVANIGTNPTYTVVIADEGSSITVKVSAKAKTGNLMTVTKASGPVTIGVAVINDKAPVATIKPTTGATGPNGTALVGNTLMGNYAYSDAENALQGTSIFRWLKVVVGDDTTVANTKSYKVMAGDEGSTLVFEVTPIAQTGTTTGLPVTANGVIVNSAPTASKVKAVDANVVVVMTAAPGDTLDASFVYTDIDGDAQDKTAKGTSYQWMRSNTDGTGRVEIDNGAGLETGMQYTIVDADLGKLVSFDVTPRADAGTIMGQTVPSSDVMVPLPNAVLPVASNAQIGVEAGSTPFSINVGGVSTAMVGSVLNGTYMVDGKAPVVGNSDLIEWTITASNDKDKIVIASTYKVVTADIGQDITFKVTPLTAAGAPGISAMDSISVNSAPIVADTTANPFVLTVVDAKGAIVTGTTVKTGDVITATYTYSDADMDEQGASVMNFMNSSSTTPVHSMTFDPAHPVPMEITHTVTAADLVDEVFTLEVTPIALTGITDGSKLMTPGLTVVTGSMVNTTVTSVSATSDGPTLTSAVEGDILTVIFKSGAGQAPSLIRWVNVDVVNNVIVPGTETVVAGMPVDQTIYTVTIDDISTVDTYIAAEVTPVASNSNNTHGIPVLSAPITIIGVP